jgi:formate-dependent nitrite reductase membrane component NrfD
LDLLIEISLAIWPAGSILGMVIMVLGLRKPVEFLTFCFNHSFRWYFPPDNG